MRFLNNLKILAKKLYKLIKNDQSSKLNFIFFYFYFFLPYKKNSYILFFSLSPIFKNKNISF
jgi:hypothetical protein